MTVDFSHSMSFYRSIKYYYNFLNTIIFVFSLFKNSKVIVQNLMKINLMLNQRSNLFRVILRKKIWNKIQIKCVFYMGEQIL